MFGNAKSDEEMNPRYTVSVKNICNSLEKKNSIGQQWQMLKESVHQTSTEIILELLMVIVTLEDGKEEIDDREKNAIDGQ